MATFSDRQQIEALLGALLDEVEGSWLLIGGGLVSLWLDARRTTEDLDLIGLKGDLEERYALLRFARAHGLPIEAVNSAADFFVRDVEGWEQEIAVLRKGVRGTLYRPTPTLFLLLKLRRLSVQDLDDCLALIAKAKDESLPIDRERLLLAIDGLPQTADADLVDRRRRLRDALA